MARNPAHDAEIAERRRKLGIDLFDERWDGMLHVNPAPHREHQDLVVSLALWLRRFWSPSARGRVHIEVNVAAPGRWPDDFRVPDLVLLNPDRFATDRGTHFEGAPTAVVEISSPGDETYEKLPFYEGIGVREVWIVDRDTKGVELRALDGDEYRLVAPHVGWLRSVATGVELRRLDDEPPKLRIRLAGHPETERQLPEPQPE